MSKSKFQICLPRAGRFVAMAAFAAGMAATVLPAQAQDNFPSGPVKIVVPYPPGGSTDAVARMIAPGMSKRLNQSVVIDNRGGAAGNIGTAIVAHAPADGYTLLFTTDVLGKNQHVYKNLGYDAIKDFAPIGMVGASPFVLLANSALPANDIAGLVAIAKKQPNSVSYATIGAGSNMHLATKLLESAANIHMTHVPYKGGGPAFNDLLGNHVQLAFSTVTSAIPLVQGKRVKVLGTAAKTRAPQLASIPTIAEQGYANVEMESWCALLAPAGTPPAVVNKLRDALKQVVEDAEFIKKTGDLGFEAKFTGPAEFDAYLKSELARWGELVRKENITAEQ